MRILRNAWGFVVGVLAALVAVYYAKRATRQRELEAAADAYQAEQGSDAEGLRRARAANRRAVAHAAAANAARHKAEAAIGVLARRDPELEELVAAWNAGRLDDLAGGDHAS